MKISNETKQMFLVIGIASILGIVSGYVSAQISILDGIIIFLLMCLIIIFVINSFFVINSLLFSIYHLGTYSSKDFSLKKSEQKELIEALKKEQKSRHNLIKLLEEIK